MPQWKASKWRAFKSEDAQPLRAIFDDLSKFIERFGSNTLTLLSASFTTNSWATEVKLADAEPVVRLGDYESFQFKFQISTTTSSGEDYRLVYSDDDGSTWTALDLDTDVSTAGSAGRYVSDEGSIPDEARDADYVLVGLAIDNGDASASSVTLSDASCMFW